MYNGENFLQEAIESALSQNYSNVEVLVINDGSTDNGATEKIALSYGDKIRYFFKENGGVATALNLGIANMNGEYFSWLSHDDVYTPEKIATQVKHLESLENKHDIIFSGWTIINSTGRELNRVLPLKRYSKEKLETPLFPLLNGMVAGCSLLIHKSHFEHVGNFREDLPTTQDFDLWFRMMRGKPCRICNGTLHKTRIHQNQGSQIHSTAHISECDNLWIKMMDELSDKEKIQISGTVQDFYMDIFMFLLKYSTNEKALAHAQKHCKVSKLIIFKHRAIRLIKNKIKDWV
ncbi:MAG: glycosyltransferase [Defluviitaleaceae bacterium]|nr:glycosyltransferase [Defluviitaleaceae bacterium]